MLTGKVIDQADNPLGAAVIARHDIKRLQADLLGQVALLQGLGFKGREVDRPQQLVIRDDAVFTDVLREQRLAGA